MPHRHRNIFIPSSNKLSQISETQANTKVHPSPTSLNISSTTVGKKINANGNHLEKYNCFVSAKKNSVTSLSSSQPLRLTQMSRLRPAHPSASVRPCLVLFEEIARRPCGSAGTLTFEIQSARSRFAYFFLAPVTPRSYTQFVATIQT